ncbi:MAG: hypothetical protein K2J40_05445 [Ruminococcus sp.]|nr:hypothetical protein [Ruminococcus sp.]
MNIINSILAEIIADPIEYKGKRVLTVERLAGVFEIKFIFKEYLPLLPPDSYFWVSGNDFLDLCDKHSSISFIRFFKGTRLFTEDAVLFIAKKLNNKKSYAIYKLLKKLYF